MGVVLPLILSFMQITNAIDQGVPPEILSSLREIRQRLDFAEECIYYNPDLEDRYLNLEGRYFTGTFDAFGTWGGDPDYDHTEWAWKFPATCRRQDESKALMELEAALDEFSQLYRTLTLPMDQLGLWIGPLKVCRDYVREIDIESDEFDRPALIVNLTIEAGSYWAEITGRSVNKQLYVRLDGTVKTKPYIFERIESNGFRITGLDQEDSARAAALATSPC